MKTSKRKVSLVTRYFGLVLVPGDTPEEEIYNVAAVLLAPHQRSDNISESEYQFDWYLQPDDIVGAEGELAEYVWKVPDALEHFPELQVETILTLDGVWHHSESGLWDEPLWVEKGRAILRRHEHCLALKHLFHI